MKRLLSREFFLSVLVAALIGIITIATVVHRYRASHKPIVITTRREGNPYYALAQRYKALLQERGVTVDVRTSDGAKTNWERLNDPNSEFNAGLMQGGAAEGKNTAGLYSMGRVLTEPVWVFYDCRDRKKIDSFEALRGKRIKIGSSGSGTNLLARTILNAYGMRDDGQRFIESDVDGIGANEAGFVVVAADLREKHPESPRIIKKLSAAKDVCLLSAAHAEGMVQQLPFLHSVVLHKGAFDLAANVPADDTTLVATRAALVVKKGLDSALQHLLAQAVLDVQNEPADDAKFFPLSRVALDADDPEFQVSPEARRVYRSEQTFFQRVLPFWIATFLDDIILYILALPFIGIIVQLFRVVPVTRDLLIKRRRDRVHGQLNELDGRISPSAHEDGLRDIESELVTITEKVRRMPLPETDRFSLRRHTDLVRGHLDLARKAR